jgi:hypothetical protein
MTELIWKGDFVFDEKKIRALYLRQRVQTMVAARNCIQSCHCCCAVGSLIREEFRELVTILRLGAFDYGAVVDISGLFQLLEYSSDRESLAFAG